MRKAESRDLRDLTVAELSAWLAERGEARYRLVQILHGLYSQTAETIEEIKTLPRSLRQELSQEFTLLLPREAQRLQGRDGTVKLGLVLADGVRIETVWMPEPAGATLCVSTQAGCRRACRFCRTGVAGFQRNLRPSEITGQILAAQRSLGQVSRLVFMGMGEPLDNLKAVIAALALICDPKGLGFSPRRITLSTMMAGTLLSRFRCQTPPVNLALSVHSALAATRCRLAPTSSENVLEKLRKELARDPLAPWQKLTLEVVLVGGINDTPDEAHALAPWARRLGARVNIIPFNHFPGAEFCPPSSAAVAKYQEILCRTGVKAFLRRSRGGDILAACGQLARG